MEARQKPSQSVSSLRVTLSSSVGYHAGVRGLEWPENWRCFIKQAEGLHGGGGKGSFEWTWTGEIAWNSSSLAEDGKLFLC